MDDLISRQAAIDAIEHRLCEPAYQHTGEDWYVGMNCAECELYDLPSAQPEIIRCKDCIHFEYFEDQFVQMTRCDVHDRCPDYTDYCSWAERKEE